MKKSTIRDTRLQDENQMQEVALARWTAALAYSLLVAAIASIAFIA